MSGGDWWETAQQLGLSWLSPAEDNSPSDEILCMLSDLCTKENLPPPSYQQFPAANRTFSSVCRVGEHTKESYGESADIALRNAAVTMLIFLKELKAEAVTHQIKANKLDENMSTLRKGIFNFHQENRSQCERKDEDQKCQIKAVQSSPLTRQSQNIFPKENGIGNCKKLNDTSRASKPKIPLSEEEMSRFGLRSNSGGRNKNKKSNKHQKHYRHVLSPADNYFKENTKDYPDEILNMYQSYKEECLSSGQDLLSLEEIWKQCVAGKNISEGTTTRNPATNGIKKDDRHFNDGKQDPKEMMLRAISPLSKSEHDASGSLASLEWGLRSQKPKQLTNDYMSHEGQESTGRMSRADDELFLPMGRDMINIPSVDCQREMQQKGNFENRNMLPASIEGECLLKHKEESMEDLSQEFIQKLEMMQIEKVSPQKHKSLNGFFLILKSSRNPGMVKLRYSNLRGDYVTQIEAISEEEKIEFTFEEEEIEVERGVDDEWLSVLRLGKDMEFVGSGSSSGEAKQMACFSALQYFKIMTR